jgi:hypothetical protein
MTVCSPQDDIYFIIETVFPKPTGLPTLGNTVGTSLCQVYRQVYQTCAIQGGGLLFKGKPVDRISVWQLAQEIFLPGKQITTRPNGKSGVFRAFAGVSVNALTPVNVKQLPEFLSKEYVDVVPTRSFYNFGADPIPHIRLYQNSGVSFISEGGSSPPTAVAVYYKSKKQLKLPQSKSEQEAIIKRLAQLSHF